MLREITPSGSGPRLWRERRARGGGGGARALVRGARVVEAAGVGRRLLSGPCRLISGRPRSGPALAPACSSTQSCHSQRGSSSPAALMSASIRPAARGQGFSARGQGRGSASRAASTRRLRERPAARRQSSRRRGERRCTRAWRGRLAREAEPAASSRVYSRHARSLCLFCGPREVRAGEGESWHGWAGGGRRSRAVAERCERSWSGRCGGWQGGDASGGAAARTGGREEAVAVHAPLRAARGSRPARSGPLRHAHPHPRLAQAAVQHERLQEEDATPRRASAAAAREGNARRASHLEVGGAASHDVVGDEGEEGPAGRRGEGVGCR